MDVYVALRKNKKPSYGTTREQNLKFQLDDSHGSHLISPEWQLLPEKTIIHFGYGAADIAWRDGRAWNLDHAEHSKWN